PGNTQVAKYSGQCLELLLAARFGERLRLINELGGRVQAAIELGDIVRGIRADSIRHRDLTGERDQFLMVLQLLLNGIDEDLLRDRLAQLLECSFPLQIAVKVDDEVASQQAQDGQIRER